MPKARKRAKHSLPVPHADAADVSSAKRKTSFLDLPAELRIEIYKLELISYNYCHLRKSIKIPRSHYVSVSDRRKIGLLRANKQIRQEALQVYWMNNEFHAQMSIRSSVGIVAEVAKLFQQSCAAYGRKPFLDFVLCFRHEPNLSDLPNLWPILEVIRRTGIDLFRNEQHRRNRAWVLVSRTCPLRRILVRQAYKRHSWDPLDFTPRSLVAQGRGFSRQTSGCCTWQLAIEILIQLAYDAFEKRWSSKRLKTQVFNRIMDIEPLAFGLSRTDLNDYRFKHNGKFPQWETYPRYLLGTLK